MKNTYSRASFSKPGLSHPLNPSLLAVGQDFITPDGQLVPHVQGEAALRQGTAFFIGGMLIGSWSE